MRPQTGGGSFPYLIATKTVLGSSPTVTATDVIAEVQRRMGY